MSDAGWHPDPTGRPGQRYHDGSRWTEHVTDAAGAQSVDHDGAERLGAGPAGDGPVGDVGSGGNGGIQIGPPPARSTSSAPAEPEPAPSVTDHDAAPPPMADQPSWGAPAAAGGAGAWSSSPPPGAGGPGGSWGGAPPAKRKRVDKVSIVGLLLALLGIGVGVAALFALPWLDVGADEVDFADARRGVDDTGIFGAVAGGLMINIAYFIVAVGGVVALAKALGSRTIGIVGVVLAVVGLVALIAVGVAAIPVETGDEALGGDFATALQSEGEDRLTQTAVFTGVVMFISTVLAVVGLLLHGIAGRILAFLGLALVALFAVGGIFVLRENYTDLAFGLASADLALGSWAIVASAVLLAIGAAVPGGRREV